MADIILTLLNGIENPKKAKHIISKYDDDTFIFANQTAPDLRSMFMIMTNQFVLSQPLNIPEPMRMHRRISSLEPYAFKKIKNIVLDLDKIETQEDYFETIEYFKNKDYSCILGKSRSWNGADNFNMKGIMRVSFENNQDIIKTALTQLQIELGSRCKVDLSVGVITSYQAPSNSKQIVYYNENGKKFTDKNVHIESVKKTIGDDYAQALTTTIGYESSQ